MGFFSWITQDTGKSIANAHSHKKTFTVYMHDDKGSSWEETSYGGYGVFGGKDYYVLLAEMNGLDGDPETLRSDGIGMAFSGAAGIKFPNLSESRDWKWVDEEPEDCPAQGYFY